MINIEQMILLSAETASMALVLAVFVAMRLRFGLLPLAVVLGIFQCIQSAQAASVYVELFPEYNISVSPGTVVFFNGTVFAMTLVRMREGVQAFSQLAGGLVFSNVLLAGILLIASWHLESPGTKLLEPVSIDFVQRSAVVLLFGTVTLFVDLLLLSWALPKFQRLIERHPFTGIFILVALVQIMDTVLFFTLAFWGDANWLQMTTSALLAKWGFGLFFALVFGSYLKYDSWSLEQLFAEMTWPMSWFAESNSNHESPVGQTTIDKTKSD